MSLRLLPCLLLFTACVTTATHEKKVADLEATRVKQERDAADREAGLNGKP